MADPTPALDPATRAALDHLADIAAPVQVSWVPQTWGWAALSIVAAAGLAWALVRRRRQREANRYRTEALAELARLEAALADGRASGEALAEVAAILKRTALAAWPRDEVASLSGGEWVAFLRKHAGRAALPDVLARLLDDSEYRSPRELAALTADDTKACTQAARAWIEAHRVSA